MNVAAFPSHTHDTIRALVALAAASGPHAAHAQAELDRLSSAPVTGGSLTHAPDVEEGVRVVCTGPGRCPDRSVPASRVAATCAGPCPNCARRTLRLASDLAPPPAEEKPEDYAAALAAAPPLPPGLAKHLADTARSLGERASTSGHAARELLALRLALASGLSAQGLAHPAPSAPPAPAAWVQVRIVPAPVHEGPIYT